jgi:phage tail sheath protein FI
MAVMKTPGVYIVEKSAFPNSTVEVATAVPAFIGYTEKADNKGKSLKNQPWRITSMAEFMSYFGFGPTPQFSFAEASGSTGDAPILSLSGKAYSLEQIKGKYRLFYSMLLFFQNGGGTCYVVSVGDYNDDIDPDKLKAGVDLLIKEQEPTIVVVPEAVLLKEADCISVQQHMLDHCGNVMKNRVTILDVYDGYRARQDPAGDPIANFRNALGTNFLNFGMAYYPWVNTTINQSKDLVFDNINPEGIELLQKLLAAELNIDALPADKAEQFKTIIDGIAKTDADPVEKVMLNKSLIALSPLYNLRRTEMASYLNLLPPSAAMAGVYTKVDNTRGVWKAPANVSLNSVISPSVNITHGDQEDLNVTPQGKSINAIRTFVGEGTLVWGARTLDGNSLDWRYINVRRTMIMLEESIRLATKALVFEPNVALTWATVKSQIVNFLTGIWKRGGLAGTSPGDAFGVFVGLGETMTPEDVLEGILRVTVLVALVRPAEFIEITFQQQMQKS